MRKSFCCLRLGAAFCLIGILGRRVGAPNVAGQRAAEDVVPALPSRGAALGHDAVAVTTDCTNARSNPEHALRHPEQHAL